MYIDYHASVELVYNRHVSRNTYIVSMHMEMSA